jgi:hypothetical protein
MATCPNKNTPEWKNLVSIQGENAAYILWDKYYGNVPKQYYVTPHITDSELNKDSKYEIYDDTDIVGQPFQFRSYDAGKYYKDNILKSGKKKITIRSEKYNPGVYSFEDIYLRVTERNDNKPIYLKDIEDPVQFKKDFIDESEIIEPQIEAFFNGEIPMYVYDISKAEADYMSLPSDFKGSADYIKAPKGLTLTSIPLLDHYLKTLYESRAAYGKKLTGIRTPEKRIEIDRKIEKINSDIDTLLTFRTAETLFEVGAKEVNEIAEEFENMTEIYQILEAIRSTDAWSNIDSYYAIDIARDFEDVREELVKQAIEIQSQANILTKKLKSKLIAKVLNMSHEFIPQSQIDKLFTPIKDLDSISALTIGIGYSADAMDQLVQKVIQSVRDLVNGETNEFNRRLNLHLSKSGQKDIDFLFPNRKLITKYNSEFYDTYSEKLEKAEKGKITWKEYYTWERENMTYILTPEGKKAYEDYKELRKTDFMDILEDGTEVFNEEDWKTEMEQWNPEGFQKFIDGKEKSPNKYGSRFFTKEPKTELSDEYKALTKEQIEFYEFFMDEVAIAHENIPKDYKFGILDRDKLANEFFFKTQPNALEIFKGTAKDVGEFIADLATVKVGKEQKDLRISSPITGRAFEEAKFKPISQFTKDVNKIGKINYLDVFKKFKIASLTFKHKHEVEDLLNIIKDLSATERLVGKNGKSGKNVIGRFNEQYVSKNATRRVDRLNYTVDAYLTEVYKNSAQPLNTDGNIEKTTRKVSLTQLADGLNTLTRVRQMALAPMSAISNIMMGMAGNYMYAAGKEDMSTETLTKAIWMLKSSPVKYWSTGKLEIGNVVTKVAAIMNRWNMIGDVTEDMAHGKSFMDKLFTFHKGGEYLNQGASTLAQMLYKKVKNKKGEFKPIYEYLKEDSEGIVSIDFDNIADDSEFKNPKEFDTFFNRVRRVNEKIHGDYNSMAMINADVIGRMFMVFRKWMPMFVKERFGKRYDDIDLGIQEGRWRAYYNLVINEEGKLDKVKGLKNLGKLLYKLMVPVISNSVKFEMMDETEMINMQKNIRELQMVAIVGVLKHLTLTLGGGADDDDKKTPMFHKYVYNQLERLHTELLFSYSPKDYKQVVRDFFPMMATINQLGELTTEIYNYPTKPDKRLYERGFRKGQSKLFVEFQQTLPVIKQIDNMFSSWSQIYSDDFTKN